MNNFPTPIQPIGSPYSKIIHLMREQGFNAGWQAEVFTVSCVDPLKFKSGGDELEIDPEDYIINADLLPKTETVKINGISNVIEYPNEIVVGQKFVAFFDHDDPEGMAYVIMKVK